MDRLPPELLRGILTASVNLSCREKNKVLPLRLVCKKFNNVLSEYVFKTIQLEFSRFTKGEIPPNTATLDQVGVMCEALYCDMLVIRDDEEVDRLQQVFQNITGQVPELVDLFDSLRRYCMNSYTFDENDFRRMMTETITKTPNLNRLKLNLPFQVIGRASQTATILLAITLQAFANRPDGSQPLRTLVIDHISDSAILAIYKVPEDIKNALFVFRHLEHIVFSIKRQESTIRDRNHFTKRLWLLISEAQKLESLCLIGWNIKRSTHSRRYRPDPAEISAEEWHSKSLPYIIMDNKRRLKNLRFLELKRIDIVAGEFQNLLQQNCTSLKELYLNEVSLKVNGRVQQEKTALWIGHGDEATKDPECLWVAEALRDMEGLNLNVLRATGLGYDDFQPGTPENGLYYDLTDPSGLGRTIDERFVEVVFGVPQPPVLTFSTTGNVSVDGLAVNEMVDDSTADDLLGGGAASSEIVDSTAAEHILNPDDSVGLINPSLLTVSNKKGLETKTAVPCPPARLRKIDWDVKTFQSLHNTTSHWRASIDGVFHNHNDQALLELQKIIGVAERGMVVLASEIGRLHQITNATMLDEYQVLNHS